MGKRRTHVVLSLGILLACCACSLASDPPVGVKFTHLTTNDGLSDNRINSILQDRRGFMWFATEDGLNRYDGNTFVVYKNNPGDPNTLSASLIQSVIEGGNGDLWIGTWGGLDKFEPTTE